MHAIFEANKKFTGLLLALIDIIDKAIRKSNFNFQHRTDFKEFYLGKKPT